MSEKRELLTRRFRLIPVSPDRVSDNWIKWTADPVLMSQLNARTAKLTRADLQRYVVSAYKRKRTIVGIYVKANGDHIGLYEAAIDPRNANVTLDVLIDQQRYDLSNVLSETDPVLLDFLARERGVEKAIALVVETYVPAIKHFEATGWKREGLLRQEYPAVDGKRRLDVIQFGRLLEGAGAKTQA
jgi:hypothetical protein